MYVAITLTIMNDLPVTSFPNEKSEEKLNKSMNNFHSVSVPSNQQYIMLAIVLIAVTPLY